ncbi:hypothetical protein [Komagataeibacter swingsii]|uniref:Uncharacterized protein n=1 Tax=Komagataeibacter swingsii TaxID=215220 RepID=A0A850NXX4_9PROT|nr:hypothetical protein [Komagataeibacter swingsii]NVN37167.1 hypothetical protein [Komagataeibacter swingsii]
MKRDIGIPPLAMDPVRDTLPYRQHMGRGYGSPPCPRDDTHHGRWGGDLAAATMPDLHPTGGIHA